MFSVCSISVVSMYKKSANRYLKKDIRNRRKFAMHGLLFLDSIKVILPLIVVVPIPILMILAFNVVFK